MTGLARWLVAAIAVMTVPAWAGVRPRYGGTLRVAMAESLASLDPAEPGDAVARAPVKTLVN
jgi:hypothetical protein